MAANPQIIMHNFGILADIMQAFSVALGLGIFMGGLFTLKRHGEMRTVMSHQMTLAWPLIKMMGGIMLLILPSIIHTGLFALFSTQSPLAYTGSGNDSWNNMMPAVIMFVRLIGVGSIIRGLIIFSRAGITGGQPGTFGRAFIHLIGGLLLVHILGTTDLLKDVFDVN